MLRNMYLCCPGMELCVGEKKITFNEESFHLWLGLKMVTIQTLGHFSLCSYKAAYVLSIRPHCPHLARSLSHR